MNVLEKILEEVENLNYYPEGMGCGIEDRCITDRYEACEYGWHEAIEAVIEVIQNMEDGKKDNGWIPVEERLPEDERMVLVTCQTKKGIRSTNRAYYDGKFWHGSGSMSGVTAWQPLPEPYKEDKQDERI